MPDESGRDPSRLAGLRTLGGAALVHDLVALFLAHAGDKLAAARAALDTGDLPAVAFAAHAIKSSAGQLGVTGVQSCCVALEDAANAGDAARSRAELDAACAALEHARPWLEGELAA